jgi:hypothetical protein
VKLRVGKRAQKQAANILMPRSQNHVYFVILEQTQTVHVLAIWGAPMPGSFARNVAG